MPCALEAHAEDRRQILLPPLRALDTLESAWVSHGLWRYVVTRERQAKKSADMLFAPIGGVSDDYTHPVVRRHVPSRWHNHVLRAPLWLIYQFKHMGRYGGRDRQIAPLKHSRFN